MTKVQIIRWWMRASIVLAVASTIPAASLYLAGFLIPFLSLRGCATGIPGCTCCPNGMSSQVQADISGITDGRCDCANQNGVFVLDHQSSPICNFQSSESTDIYCGGVLEISGNHGFTWNTVELGGPGVLFSGGYTCPVSDCQAGSVTFSSAASTRCNVASAVGTITPL